MRGELEFERCDSCKADPELRLCSSCLNNKWAIEELEKRARQVFSDKQVEAFCWCIFGCVLVAGYVLITVLG